MNLPHCRDTDAIAFLLAAQRTFTCTEAARCQPESAQAPAHDAFTRLLQRQPPDTAALWQEVQGLVRRREGALVLDDTTLDKPFAHRMGLVTRQWSGRHKRVVWGINLLPLLWTDGAAGIPCDGRVYDKPWGGETKNAHFRAMLATAAQRGFAPRCVLFDSWYASRENLKAVRALGWDWLTRLTGNRLVNPEGRGVHLKAYGFIRVFRTVAKDGDAEYWATSQLDMTEDERKMGWQGAWRIEMYHRGVKQGCGIAKAQVRSAVGQRTHLLFALRAFVRLEVERLRTSRSWYEAKVALLRPAIQAYLTHPLYLLPPTA